MDRIVPDCIRAIENGLPIKLRNPNSTRPWQHVLEPLSGYLALAAKLYLNQTIFLAAGTLGHLLRKFVLFAMWLIL